MPVLIDACSGQKVIPLSDRSPAERFRECFICSFVFIAGVFQGMRGKWIQTHGKEKAVHRQMERA